MVPSNAFFSTAELVSHTHKHPGRAHDLSLGLTFAATVDCLRVKLSREIGMAEYERNYSLTAFARERDKAPSSAYRANLFETRIRSEMAQQNHTVAFLQQR